MNDKPLYFQGKWWFISNDRTYFHYPDPIDDWPVSFWLRYPNQKEYDYVMERDFGITIRQLHRNPNFTPIKCP